MTRAVDVGQQPVSKALVLLGAGLTAALLLSGCTGVRGPDAEIAPQADCADTGTAGRIPAGFEPVRVMLCEEFGTVVDESGTWTGPSTNSLEGDLEPLIDALNEPDDIRWPGPCTAHMVIVPQIWLVDSTGQAVNATYPADGCGQPKTAAVNFALSQLTVIESSVDRQELIESEASVEAGCSIRYEPLRLVGTTTPVAPFALVSPDRIDGMRLCQYAADPDPTDDSFMTGTFTSGSMLSADEGRIILEAAGYDVMPLIDCFQPAAAFVVAQPLIAGQDTGGVIMIELDHCQRLFGATGFIFASEEVLELVQAN